MSIRTDLIDAKLSGTLQKTASEMIAKQIVTYADFCDFCDCLEESKTAGIGSDGSLKALLAGVGMLGGLGVMGGHYMLTKKRHNDILDNLLNDPQFPDKNKVKEVFSVVSKFAPRSISNPIYAKSVVEQLYNAPMITPETIKNVLAIENSLGGGTSVPNVNELISSMQKSVTGGKH